MNNNFMTLLYITNAIDGSGGLERVLSVKTKVFTEDFGYEIHIITLSKAEPAEDQASKKDLFFPFSDKIVQHKIDVSGNALQYISKYISGIKKVVAKVKPEIILVCDDGLKGFFLPKILGKKIPVIYERHVSKLIEISENQSFIKSIFTKAKFYLMDVLAKDFTKFIVLTEGNKNEWKSKNVQVIPNPLPFFPDEKSTLTNKKVIAVGKQSYQKGFDRLLNAWSPENPNSNIPAVTTVDSNAESRFSTYYVENGSYLKLRVLQIGYTLPKSVSDNYGISNFRLYTSVQNLWTIKSKNFTGVDPETPAFGYPLPLTVNFGINISL